MNRSVEQNAPVIGRTSQLPKTLAMGMLLASTCLGAGETKNLADLPGVCDPHLHVFGDRAWLFSSHDRAPTNTRFAMDDWQLFSSPDLVHWTREFVLRPEDTFIGKPFSDCWAPDGAERNGHYYWYFSRGTISIGVARSGDGPAGPYRDALGRPLVPEGLADTASYDPHVFIDDDSAQTPYLIWGRTCGGKHYYIARLNEDMVSLAEPPRAIVSKGWREDDASSVFKRDGIYYMMSHGSRLSTATNVYGPYTYHADWEPIAEGWIDHPNLFAWNHQDYLIFGEPLIPEREKHFFRRTRIVYAHRRADGSWTSEPFLRRNELGVGQYDASWARIEAEWYFAASRDTRKRELAPGGGFAVAVAPGSWLQFPQVHHLRPKQRLVLALSTVARSGLSIEVRRGDHRGALLGRVAIAASERGQAAQMEPALELEIGDEPGTLDLCFVFAGTDKELALFDYWLAVSPDPQD